MQTFISKYGLAAHLALLAVAPLILYPFCGPNTLATVQFWLSFVAAIWLLMEPSRRAEEMLHEARVRVRGAVLRDPLFWFFSVLVVLAAIRCLNGGIVRRFDTIAHKWVLAGPSVQLLPGSVDELGLMNLSTVIAATLVITGCRQALGKSARIAFASFIGLFGGITAIALIVLCHVGKPEILALAGFSGEEWRFAVDSVTTVSSAGNAFGLCFLASIVGLAGLFECQWNKLLLLFSFAVGATGIGLFYFASPATFVLYMAMGIVLLLGCIAYLWLTLSGAVVFRFIAALLLAAAVPAAVVTCLAPAEMTSFHADLLGGIGDFPTGLLPDGFWERRAELTEQAAAFWKDAPWLGLGQGAYPIQLWLTGAALKGGLATGTLNGWWLLLAERGIIGVLTVVLPLGFMVFTLVWRIIGAWGRRVFLPLAALGLAGLLLTGVTSFWECSFLRADSLLLTGSLFALAASTFPAPRKQVDPDEGVV